MPKYVAFLRAINVGGHTVKMDQLRTLFEAIGFSQVETFIASGNVIFDSNSKNTNALEQKIEKYLKQSLGYEVRTFVRTLNELAASAAYKPFPESKLNGEGRTLFVGFTNEQPGKEAARKLSALSSDTDGFHLHGRELYWLRLGGFSDSEFSGARLEKILGLPLTFRNINTVRKLAAKYSDERIL